MVVVVASPLFPGEQTFHIRLFLGSIGQENGVVGNHEDRVDVDADNDYIDCFRILVHVFIGVFAFAGDVPRLRYVVITNIVVWREKTSK